MEKIMRIRNRFLVAGFILICLFGSLSAGLHFLPQPSGEFIEQFNPPPGKEWFVEQRAQYEAHPVSEFLHVIPGLLLLLIVPLQLSQRIRASRPKLHRVLGRVFMGLGISAGLSGLYIGLVYPFAGIKETLFIVPYGIAFLYCLIVGVLYARQKAFALHKKWMLRTVALGLTPVTMRLIFNVYIFVTGTPGVEVFAECMLAGMLLNMFVLYLYNQSQNSTGIAKQKMPLGRYE